LVTARKL
jgi:hypothetical protein